MLDEVRFLRHRPYLYHFTSAGAWPTINRFGLLCTADLLALLPATGQRDVLQRRKRTSCTIAHPDGGNIVIRDQKPLSRAGLMHALQGAMSPDHWVDLLNSRVFFWTDPEHAAALTGAATYRAQAGLLLKLQTEPILRAYRHRIQLADINTGYTLRKPATRGPETFRSLADYPSGGIARVKELTILGSIPDLRRYVVDRIEWQATPLASKSC